MYLPSVLESQRKIKIKKKKVNEKSIIKTLFIASSFSSCPSF